MWPGSRCTERCAAKQHAPKDDARSEASLSRSEVTPVHGRHTARKVAPLSYIAATHAEDLGTNTDEAFSSAGESGNGAEPGV